MKEIKVVNNVPHKNPYIHGGNIALIGIFGLPIFGMVTDIYPPLFDLVWIASWGFGAGAIWSEIYHSKQKYIDEKLTTSIRNTTKQKENK